MAIKLEGGGVRLTYSLPCQHNALNKVTIATDPLLSLIPELTKFNTQLLNSKE